MEYEIALFPNPSTIADVFVDFKAKESENIMVKIINPVGQVMHTAVFKVVSGRQSLKLSTSNLSAGIYLIQIQNERKPLKTIRWIKY